MANLKNITEVPMVESAEGLNLIVNDNGAAKQIAASAVGAQADWAETDASNPAFIKNKPVEEWDLDLTCDITWNTEASAQNDPVFTVAEGYSYETFIAKVDSSNIPKVKFRMNLAISANEVVFIMNRYCNIMRQDGAMSTYGIFAFMGGNAMLVILNPDGTFTMIQE